MFPTPGYRAISRLHLPLPLDKVLLQLLPMLKEKWSNILQLCRVDEWIATAPELAKKKKKGKSLKQAATSVAAGVIFTNYFENLSQSEKYFLRTQLLYFQNKN